MELLLPVMSLISLGLLASSLCQLTSGACSVRRQTTLVPVYLLAPGCPGALITRISDRHLQGRYLVGPETF
ncbi:uncharacterized protein METZ01_LOCUS379481 [marine metagenome]|uniref:Uncharacterized protein n=1 Tax=marine metagenome TaxID=408172 RepID=A0A382TY57_9ZZZZ